MKLKNKKTGEVVEKFPETMVINTGSQIYNYSSLAELNEEWEDYEEPKEYWYIDYEGDILLGETDNSSAEKMMMSIGNYFNTLSEAEKAVEKLKAWKRLKDKGFEFCGWCEDIGFRFTKSGAWQTEVQPDLDLLFGGEE